MDHQPQVPIFTHGNAALTGCNAVTVVEPIRATISCRDSTGKWIRQRDKLSRERRCDLPSTVMDEGNTKHPIKKDLGRTIGSLLTADIGELSMRTNPVMLPF
jgi:hypothetical protein